MRTQALHVVVSHYAVALLCGVVVGRRGGRVVMMVASTLTLRDTRDEAARMLSALELVLFDDAYRWDQLSDAERDAPIYAPPTLAHPIVPIYPHAGLPLAYAGDAAELVGTSAFRRLSD